MAAGGAVAAGVHIVSFLELSFRFCNKLKTRYDDCYKGPFLYYLKVKGWVGGIAKYLLFLTGVGGWFWITLT